MSLQTRLQALITAIGADVKRLDGRIDSVSGGGGSDPWTHQALTTAWTNSTVTASDVFTGFTPAASTRYIIDALLMVQSAAATTGIQTGLIGPTGGTRAAVKIISASAAATDLISHLGLNVFQVATAGLATPSLLSIQAIVEYGTPGAGNLRIQGRSEIAASLVTIHPGSSMRWRTI